MKKIKQIYLLIVENPLTVVVGLIALDVLTRIITWLLSLVKLDYSNTWNTIYNIIAGLNFVVLILLITYGMYYAIRSIFNKKDS